ncbi:murein L,D-transpeptidase YafK [Bradyrhizobium sp. LB7.2]
MLQDWGLRDARHGVGSVLISRSLARAVLASVALAASIVLAGCDTDQVSLATNAKANQPVPPKLLAAMVEKDMDLQSPILVRLFKQEAELEIWKQARNGQFALLKTYPICRWSGDLGPKVREGDRQAPEGFYSINPGQMNPQSAYYLSFNTGFPNAFDRALGRTGSQLMVHGDCSSRGCYAMTDEQIAEIYSLGRESFFGGQKAFQFQAYPFKMTPVNMAKHRNNPNMPFWKMIKEGYDHFEVTRQEPKVDFCEKKYVFDATKAPDAKRDPVFDASAKCPAYVIPEDIARAVREKECARPGRVQQAGFARHTGGAHEHRHRRRHEQDLCREDSGRLDRSVRGRRRHDLADAGDGEGAGHDPRPRQSAEAESRRSRALAAGRAGRRRQRARQRPCRQRRAG